MLNNKMTSKERRAVFSLASIMSLRMIGLFMVLPVFSLYAYQLKDATPALIGIAMGIYGLSQAVFQVPFGTLSDRYGRKPLILIGLLLFCLGSVFAACAHSIYFMILGRTLQGAGAVGSTILATISDLTREEQRTKSMAITGITIGASFSLAMLIGPLLIKWMPVNDLFILAMLCGCVAIVILYTLVPLVDHPNTPEKSYSFFELLKIKNLITLNCGIFILHTVFTAFFVVIPISLVHFFNLHADHQWRLYLLTLLPAFLVSFICIGLAERKQQIKFYFLSGILILALSFVFFWLMPMNMLAEALGLFLFFTGFSILEAFLPSLISRTVPARCKGTALGIFSCAQFLGIFVGGVLGGWLYGQFSFPGVYLFCVTLIFFWFMLAYPMQPHRDFIRFKEHATLNFQEK